MLVGHPTLNKETDMGEEVVTTKETTESNCGTCRIHNCQRSWVYGPEQGMWHLDGISNFSV